MATACNGWCRVISTTRCRPLRAIRSRCKSLQDAFGGLFPFGSFEEMGKQNLALFEKTMKMFSPFPAPGREKPLAEREEARRRSDARRVEGPDQRLAEAGRADRICHHAAGHSDRR